MLILALGAFRKDTLLKYFSLMATKKQVTYYPKLELILLQEPYVRLTRLQSLQFLTLT